ncbi:hypothetical protein EDS67_27715 [candidate division KSB1 bacterium]|nr:MAG: hypothetical protein EDS67_27715 [candidate division KSB1 bacterium]MBC6947678.1 hypothetical protein [candidate division KSB1 bacterium]MCE7943536.1 hypothetical protein [Chlorobi bacterium CHB1]MDL1876559.1 hypothetical protein [Cytophagia bacterium CHB2]
MATYTRLLSYQTPLLRGDDVQALQQRLLDLGYTMVGIADGYFGRATDSAVRSYQQAHGLVVDGVVGPRTWAALFNPTPTLAVLAKIKSYLVETKKLHRYRDSVSWRLSKSGVIIEPSMKPERFSVDPHPVVRRVWQTYRIPIENWAATLGVPVELIIATICTETRGQAEALRLEPGYISDEQTPHRVSPGLMQTLISTARMALNDNSIDRAWLLQPANSIRAGTAYIAQQAAMTRFDPPKVACAYNAGAIIYNGSKYNRWKMRQYPINSSEHADRLVKWLNECFAMFAKDNLKPATSLFSLID